MSVGLTTKQTSALVLAVIVAVFVAYASWSSAEHRAASEQKALEEARLLTTVMNASWDYVDDVQSRINYDSTGRYDFKGVYCSVAGKSIARKFTRTTDCTVRYTRENPRTPTDAPDELEARALKAFEAGAEEYWEIVDYEGTTSLRYLAALEISYGCLECHGEPAGEVDETGFYREGMQLGDLAGAISLVLPMDSYVEEAAARTRANTILFVVLMAIVIGCMALVNAQTRRHKRALEAVNEQLGEANEALKRESEYKSTFLATMSHELRAPLASNLALADVWVKTEGGDGESHEIMAVIKGNSAALLETVNNTLDAASLEAQRYPVEIVDTDVYDVVLDVERTIKPLADKKGIDFAVHIGHGIPVLGTDPDILFKISVNLLSNAVKFTEAGGSVRYSVSLCGTWLKVKVEDSGIGIAEEDLKVVFERFRQADSSISRRYGGSGLGLTLVREMAELLGGTATVQSSLGEGSVFEVSLPCTLGDGA